MEQLLMELPVSPEESEQDEYLQSELQATEQFYQTTTPDSLLESLDPTEQMLEGAQQIPEPVVEETPIVVAESQPVPIEPEPVVIEPAPMPRELQRWEDWKQVEQSVAFAPWKIESDPSEYEASDSIELAQPIEELIAPETAPSPA
jgi:hypothetical protein